MKMGEALNWFSPKKITGEKKRKFGAVWIWMSGKERKCERKIKR